MPFSQRPPQGLPPQGLPPEGMPGPPLPPTPPQLGPHPGPLPDYDDITTRMWAEDNLGPIRYPGLDTELPMPEPTPPGPYSPNFPSGGPLSPMELGEIESSIPNPTRDEELFGPNQFPLADLPTRPFPPNSPIAPAPQTPQFPGNPIAGRGPAPPIAPKTPNPFGGGR